MSGRIRPLLLAATALLILATSGMSGQVKPTLRQGNKDLERLFKEDQADPRPTGTPEQTAETTARATERRRQAAAILAAGGATTAADYYNVALLYSTAKRRTIC